MAIKKFKLYFQDAPVDPVEKEKKEDQELLEKYQEVWDLKLEPKKQEELLNIISKMVDDYEQENSTFKDQLYKWDDQYEGVLPDKVYPHKGCANYHDPITEMNVNSIYARVIRRFRDLNYLRVKQYKSQKDRSLITQKYLRHLFAKKLDFINLLMSTVRDPIKYGTGTYITTWYVEECDKTVVEPVVTPEKIGEGIDGEPVYTDKTTFEIKKYKRYKYQPKIEWVSLLDYGRSDDTNTLEEPTWEFRRMWKSAVKFQLSAVNEGYDEKNVKEILADSLRSTASKSVENLNEREIIEWWGWIRLDDKATTFPERIVYTYDRKAKKFLKCQRFPYLFDESNFSTVRLERRSHNWRGRGICQKLEHVNAESDKLHDIYIDSAALVACKSFKKKRGADTDFLLEPFYPGVVWEVSNMDDIQVMELGETPVSPLKELELLDQKASRQTGIGAYQTGQESGQVSQPTASGQLAIIQEGNIVLDEVAKEFMNLTIRIARQVLSMIHQFRPEGDLMMLMDEEEMKELTDPYEISIDQLVDDPELIIVDKSVLEEQEYKNQAVEQYNAVRQDPILTNIPRIYLGCVRNLFTAYKTIDADLLVPTEQEYLECQKMLQDTAEAAKAQIEIQKLQLTAQRDQMQAQLKQQQMQQQQQAQQAAQQQQQAALAQQGAEADADRNMQMEQQARDQDFNMVQKVLGAGEETAPAPTE